MFLPIVNRIDSERLAGRVPRRRAAEGTAGQIRLDITNFGNLLNDKWGVGSRLVNNQILTSPAARMQPERLTYNLQNAQRQPDHDAAADVGGDQRTST